MGERVEGRGGGISWTFLVLIEFHDLRPDASITGQARAHTHAPTHSRTERERGEGGGGGGC